MNVQRLIIVAISLGLSLAGAHGAALAQQTIPPAITTNANGDCVTYGSPGRLDDHLRRSWPGIGLDGGDSTGRGGYGPVDDRGFPGSSARTGGGPGTGRGPSASCGPGTRR